MYPNSHAGRSTSCQSLGLLPGKPALLLRIIALTSWRLYLEQLRCHDIYPCLKAIHVWLASSAFQADRSGSLQTLDISAADFNHSGIQPSYLENSTKARSSSWVTSYSKSIVSHIVSRKVQSSEFADVPIMIRGFLTCLWESV